MFNYILLYFIMIFIDKIGVVWKIYIGFFGLVISKYEIFIEEFE